MAESGVVAAAFDALASDGRNGLGCVVVFAAGNRPQNGTDYTLEYPLATHPALITVAASTIVGAEVKVSDSNFGPSIDVCAPAGDGNAGTSTVSTSISKTYPPTNAYDYFGRTSAACPQVAGVAALMLAVNPSLEAEEVRDILQSTAFQIDNTNTDPLGSYDATGHSQWYGYGRICAQAALQAAADSTSGVSPAPPTGVRVIT
jgi:subtilisin family serine protease